MSVIYRGSNPIVTFTHKSIKGLLEIKHEFLIGNFVISIVYEISEVDLGAQNHQLSGPVSFSSPGRITIRRDGVDVTAIYCRERESWCIDSYVPATLQNLVSVYTWCVHNQEDS